MRSASVESRKLNSFGYNGAAVSRIEAKLRACLRLPLTIRLPVAGNNLSPPVRRLVVVCFFWFTRAFASPLCTHAYVFSRTLFIGLVRAPDSEKSCSQTGESAFGFPLEEKVTLLLYSGNHQSRTASRNYFKYAADGIVYRNQSPWKAPDHTGEIFFMVLAFHCLSAFSLPAGVAQSQRPVKFLAACLRLAVTEYPGTKRRFRARNWRGVCSSERYLFAGILPREPSRFVQLVQGAPEQFGRIYLGLVSINRY